VQVSMEKIRRGRGRKKLTACTGFIQRNGHMPNEEEEVGFFLYGIDELHKPVPVSIRHKRQERVLSLTHCSLTISSTF
jgi:hypothetical protein